MRVVYQTIQDCICQRRIANLILMHAQQLLPQVHIQKELVQCGNYLLDLFQIYYICCLK